MHASFRVGIPLLILLLSACGDAAPPLPRAEADEPANAPEDEPSRLRAIRDRLRPLSKKLGAPKPGDWLDQHEEDGQTLDEYLTSDPVTARASRRVIYVTVIGELSKKQREVVNLAAEYLALYFGLPTRKAKPVLVDGDWPPHARRTHPSWGVRQLLTTHILYRVLKPLLPNDAAVFLGFTAWDLWPGRGWNFVFGQASLEERVGVWSIHRNGDPAESAEAFRTCLRRTLKTATHEAGHVFGIEHCIAHECNMCGSNHREESDRHPLSLCCECLPKVCWATGVEPRGRYEALVAFCKRHGLAAEAAFFARAREALDADPESPPRGS